MSRLWILLISVLAAGTALADSSSRADFAYGAGIRLEGEGSLYSVVVGAHLYRHVTDPRLADIRVFDSEGEVIPHAVVRTKIEKADPPAPVRMPIFPLFEKSDHTPPRLTVRFDTDPDGAILDLRSHSEAEPGAKIRGYLIDMSALEERPETLEILWKEDRHSGIVARVRIEESDDLAAWRPLVEATVVTMTYGGQRLEQREIELRSRPADYLRLVWLSPEDSPELSGVLGRFPEKNRELPFKSIIVSGSRTSDAPNSLVFDTWGRFPVDRINLRIPGENRLLDAVLKSRPDLKAPWQTRYRGLFYNIRVNGVKIENAPVPVSEITDRYWRLEVLSGGPAKDDSLPQLELQWMPHEVVFLAGGNPPFMLAYGNFGIKKNDQPVRKLLENLKDRESDVLIRSAALESPVTLGGEERLQYVDPDQWKRWILWGLLISSVFLLTWMAWRLYRQMSGDSSEPAKKPE